MNVAIYARYSSDKQTEQSIEGQLRVCKEYCNSNGYNVVEIYIDRALSASKNIDKRVDFQRMIKESSGRRYEAIVVYKLDRFARNRYDSARYKSALRKNGVKVVSATEGISDSPEGIILESVLEGYAEYYSAELSQKVTRGMRESALKANSTGGTIPLGYKIKNKKLVIDEKTAPAVRKAFEMYANGYKISEICRELNDSGFRTRKGNKFVINSFSGLFKNKKYIGTYCYNKEIEIENAIPPIVDKEIFERVQKRMSINAKSPARSKATIEYLLTTKLFCGHCGKPMVGESTKKNGINYYYYACQGKKRFHICDKKNVKKDVIEKAVVEHLIKKLTPENIAAIADTALNQLEKDKSNNMLLNSIMQQICEVDKNISNLLKAIEAGAVSEALAKRLNDLEEQKNELTIRAEKERAFYPEMDREHIVFWLSKFSRSDPDDIRVQRMVIDLLVNTIFLYDNPDGKKKIVITFNLTNEPNSAINISDLDGAGAPLQNNPNFFVIGTIAGFIINISLN